MLILFFVTIYKTFSKIFIPRFENIETIGNFSVLEIRSVGSSSSREIEEMSFSNRSSIIRSIFCYLITLFYILPFFFSIWITLIAMIYTISFKNVNEKSLFKIISIRKTIPELKSTLSIVNLTLTSKMIINLMLITRISL